MLSRRSFLALGAGVVTACGSKGGSESDADSGSTAAADATGTAGSEPASGFVVVQRFPNTSLTPGAVRLPISIARDDGALLPTGPETISGTLRDEDGATLSTFTAPRHGLDMAIPYWPITVELEAAGIYYLDVEGATGEPTPFQLFDPAEVDVPVHGRALPAFATPTVDDARGVDPICTRSPEPCPFHAQTLEEALAAGLPVVYIVGTPAHCSTGTCAPGLDYLVEQAARLDGRATFVHAEVYTDNAALTVAPAVRAVGLDYEPVIFVTDAAGTVTTRVDIVWDGEELATILDTALA